ncbi:MAG: nucleotidyltransferase [Ginsengibacter sp.]
MKKLKLETDFIDFVELCNKHEVEYLVIGGYAVSIHGYPRSTKDLDICIKLSEENAVKMVEVIIDFGFGSLNLKKEDFLKRDFITQLGHEPVRIDILNDLDGVPFEQAWKNKKVIALQGAAINFIGYADLLKVKAKAGRPQDIADIDKLKFRNKEK